MNPKVQKETEEFPVHFQVSSDTEDGSHCPAQLHKKMKDPNSAPLVMIPQRCQGCLTPGQVCHLQLLGEQGRSERTKGAAILRT